MKHKNKIMKQWNHQRRDRLLIEKEERNTANKLELQKKGAKQYKTVDSVKNY